MDSDRRSAVSSFYGGRRSSVDALNRDYASPSLSDHRARRDSSSSFFNPNATGNLPRGATEPTRVHGAGYNRMSYLDAGREEPVKSGNDDFERPNEGGWDVYADFNNAGPRYSHAFGLGQSEPTYVEIRPLVSTWLIFVKATNRSHHPFQQEWKRTLPRDLWRWSPCLRLVLSGERMS
jgi:hypothetical protein